MHHVYTFLIGQENQLFLLYIKCMCRLLLINNKTSKTTLANILSEFRKQSKNGMTPDELDKGHKDGWGFVSYNLNNLSLFKKGYKYAYIDKEFKAVENKLLRSSGDIIMGHLRKGSVGKNTINNSHPFVYKNFSFCQNGTVFNSEKIKINKKYKTLIGGSTDTEKLFYYILSETQEKLTKESFELAIKKIREKFDYTAMNILFSDGGKTIVLRDVNLKNIYVKEEKLENYYSLFIGINKVDNYSIVVSEKIKIKGVKWELIKNRKLLEIMPAK